MILLLPGSSLFSLLQFYYFFHATVTTGEGNGTPLQYSCLETPMGGGAWWPAVHGVAQSRTQLKRLGSSSSRSCRQTARLWRKCEISEKVLVSSTPFLF